MQISHLLLSFLNFSMLTLFYSYLSAQNIYLFLLELFPVLFFFFLLPALALSELAAASSLLHRKAADKKAAAEKSHKLSQLATAPGFMHKIPGFDHCSISECFSVEHILFHW